MTTNTATDKGAKPATATTKTAEVTTEDDFDKANAARLFARVKAEVNGIIYDAEKKRPLFSATHQSAIAKRAAVLKALESFIEMVDNAKKTD